MHWYCQYLDWTFFIKVLQTECFWGWNWRYRGFHLALAIKNLSKLAPFALRFATQISPLLNYQWSFSIYRWKIKKNCFVRICIDSLELVEHYSPNQNKSYFPPLLFFPHFWEKKQKCQKSISTSKQSVTVHWLKYTASNLYVTSFSNLSYYINYE